MSTLNRSCRTLLLPLLIACLAVLAGCGAAGSAGDAENTPRSLTHVLSPGEQVAITATDTLKLERVSYNLLVDDLKTFRKRSCLKKLKHY